jgi:cyclopropane fatty-acyl-phospholipid synthase-like methyltransferase
MSGSMLLIFNTVLDAGSNEGEFSQLVANRANYILSTDLDHSAISKLYRKIQQENISTIYPLIMDLSNPSPAIGVNNKETTVIFTRM